MPGSDSPSGSLVLSPRQAAVLSWRLLMGDEPLSWPEIAGRLGVTQDQARLAYSAACSKIRVCAGVHYPLTQKEK